MMEKLMVYDNLIKAIGALQFTNRNMQPVVTKVWRAWKDFTVESRLLRHDQEDSSSGLEQVEVREHVHHLEDEPLDFSKKKQEA